MRFIVSFPSPTRTVAITDGTCIRVRCLLLRASRTRCTDNIGSVVCTTTMTIVIVIVISRVEQGTRRIFNVRRRTAKGPVLYNNTHVRRGFLIQTRGVSFVRVL